MNGEDMERLITFFVDLVVLVKRSCKCGCHWLQPRMRQQAGETFPDGLYPREDEIKCPACKGGA